MMLENFKNITGAEKKRDSDAFKALLHEVRLELEAAAADDENTTYSFENAWLETERRFWSESTDCNDPTIPELALYPFRNQWTVYLRQGAKMTDKEHSAWAQGVHERDRLLKQGHHPDEDPLDFKGMVLQGVDLDGELYNDDKEYPGEFSCLTKRNIEEHEDVSSSLPDPTIHTKPRLFRFSRWNNSIQRMRDTISKM